MVGGSKRPKPAFKGLLRSSPHLCESLWLCTSTTFRSPWRHFYLCGCKMGLLTGTPPPSWFLAGWNTTPKASESKKLVSAAHKAGAWMSKHNQSLPETFFLQLMDVRAAMRIVLRRSRLPVPILTPSKPLRWKSLRFFFFSCVENIFDLGCAEIGPKG